MRGFHGLQIIPESGEDRVLIAPCGPPLALVSPVANIYPDLIDMRFKMQRSRIPSHYSYNRDAAAFLDRSWSLRLDESTGRLTPHVVFP